MDANKFVEMYENKYHAALNELDNNLELKQAYIDLINHDLSNSSEEIKDFFFKQLITRQAENMVLLELIQDLVFDERNS